MVRLDMVRVGMLKYWCETKDKGIPPICAGYLLGIYDMMNSKPRFCTDQQFTHLTNEEILQKMFDSTVISLKDRDIKDPSNGEPFIQNAIAPYMCNIPKDN